MKIREITHPKGPTLKTPFLIPSFSSKGKRIYYHENTMKSEASDIIRLVKDVLTKYYLISAYDLYFNLVPDIASLPRTDIVVVDSGGYEISHQVEGNVDLQYHYANYPWSYKNYIEVLERWSRWEKNSLLPAVFVSFDHPDILNPFEKQIDDLLQIKEKFPGQMYDFLIKRTSESYDCLFEKIFNHRDAINQFDIVGFTEKELGDSIVERLKCIRNFRSVLDAAGIDKPIHIFGGLDPSLTVLYFMAGAEIFDGLSWSRYQYDSGISTYHYNFRINPNFWLAHEDTIKIFMMDRNLKLLLDLEDKMRFLAISGRFDHFEYFKDFYEEIFRKIEGGLKNE